jgi:N-methylhydantoinase A/oxoprolinase/acetone carboxylase beta subunit
MSFKNLLDLETCSKASCKEFDTLKADVRKQHNAKLQEINDVMLKDYAKWDKQRKSLEQEMHKKLHNSYACIVKKCDRQLRELIKTNIKDNENIVKSWESALREKSTKESSQEREMYQQQIKIAKQNIKDMQHLLKSKDIDITKVQNTLKNL